MQQDLFGAAQAASFSMNASQKTDFLERHRISLRLDQAVVALILSVVVFVLVFSYGVETGKRYAMAELKAERAKREVMVQELSRKLLESQQRDAEKTLEKGLPVPAMNQKNASVMAAKEPVNPASSPAPAAVTAKSSQTLSGKYTIQMITFVSQIQAQKEIKKLADKGYQGFIIPSGKHYQVCVNAFESRQRASEILKELKTQGFAPRDAYVRNMG